MGSGAHGIQVWRQMGWHIGGMLCWDTARQGANNHMGTRVPIKNMRVKRGWSSKQNKNIKGGMQIRISKGTKGREQGQREGGETSIAAGGGTLISHSLNRRTNIWCNQQPTTKVEGRIILVVIIQH